MSTSARPEPVIVREVPTRATRAIVALAEEVLGRPLTSALTFLRPWPPGEEDGAESTRPEHSSRLEFGASGTSVVVVEHVMSIYVAGPSGSRLVTSAYGEPDDRLLLDRVREVLSPLVDEEPSPLSNEEVEDLTRRVYALPRVTARALVSGFPGGPDDLPVLASGFGAGRLASAAGATRVRTLRTVLDDLAAGVPPEWALRRAEESG